MIWLPVPTSFTCARTQYVTIRTAAARTPDGRIRYHAGVGIGERFVRIHRNTLVARKAILGFERVKGESTRRRCRRRHWEVLLKTRPSIRSAAASGRSPSRGQALTSD